MGFGDDDDEEDLLVDKVVATSFVIYMSSTFLATVLLVLFFLQALIYTLSYARTHTQTHFLASSYNSLTHPLDT